jgi:hypothetical protein
VPVLGPVSKIDVGILCKREIASMLRRSARGQQRGREEEGKGEQAAVYLARASKGKKSYNPEGIRRNKRKRGKEGKEGKGHAFFRYKASRITSSQSARREKKTAERGRGGDRTLSFERGASGGSSMLIVGS